MTHHLTLSFIASLMFLSAALADEPTNSESAAPSSASEGTRVEPALGDTEITFQEIEEPLAQRLFAAIPALLELKYVVQLEIPRPKLNPGRELGLSHQPLNALHDSTRPDATFLRGLAESVPKDRLPDEAILKVLLERTQERLWYTTTPGQALQVQILGTTSEEAKQLTETLITLYDYGLALPLQQEAHASQQKFQKELEEARTQQGDVLQTIEALRKELESLRELPPETLTSLVTQQLTLEVETEGTRARIDAANRLLKEYPQLRETIVPIKISSEIDLAGQVARQRALGARVERGEQSRQTREKLGELEVRYESLQRKISSREEWVQRLQQIQQQYRTFPFDRQNIPIQRLEWEASR